MFNDGLRTASQSLAIDMVSLDTDRLNEDSTKTRMVFASAVDSKAFKRAYATGAIARFLSNFVEISVSVAVGDTRYNTATVDGIFSQVSRPDFSVTLAEKMAAARMHLFTADFVVSGVTRIEVDPQEQEQKAASLAFLEARRKELRLGVEAEAEAALAVAHSKKTTGQLNEGSGILEEINGLASQPNQATRSDSVVDDGQ